MVLVDELQAVAIQAQAAAAKQGDTVRSLKASLKDGKADKVGFDAYMIHTQDAWSFSPMPTYRLTGEQSEVDAAIQQLKNLKAEADVAQKVNLVSACVTRVTNALG